MTQLGRVLTAMVTPFSEDGSRVDLDAAKRLAKALLDSGTEGLVITGTTGESPTLSHREKLDLYEAVLEVTRATGTPLIAGTTGNNTAESVELSREAAHLGVDAILAPVPYYNNPPQEGLYQHFKAIANAVDLPVILYNIPSRSPRNMEVATTLRLGRDVENIVGVKEASGNLTQIGRIISVAPEAFLVWSGNDSDTLSLMGLGGYGVISVASHLVGNQIQALVQASLEGDNARAAELHYALTPLVDALFAAPNPIPLKYALNRVGMPVGPCRLPLVEIDSANQKLMDAVLEKTRLDLPVGAAV